MRRSSGQRTRRRKRSDAGIEAALMNFIEYHPARRLSTNLRTMLIDFLMTDGATESAYLQDLLYDLGGLFDLLDVLESESGTSDR